MAISYQYSKKQQSNYQQTARNMQERGEELGQPDWNFGPRYKKCTLAAVKSINS